MGGFFSCCAAARPEVNDAGLRTESHVLGSHLREERPVLKAMLGPIGGRGPLNSEQKVGAERFGM